MCSGQILDKGLGPLPTEDAEMRSEQGVEGVVKKQLVSKVGDDLNAGVFPMKMDCVKGAQNVEQSGGMHAHGQSLGDNRGAS
ncbi:hypothetical protein Q3G72_014907 [Acer saccharum]|nr:hypothetical protein Q3G72_014907 [Acer saccharum]